MIKPGHRINHIHHRKGKHLEDNESKNWKILREKKKRNWNISLKETEAFNTEKKKIHSRREKRIKFKTQTEQKFLYNNYNVFLCSFSL